MAEAKAQITAPCLQKIQFIIPASNLVTALGTTKMMKMYTEKKKIMIDFHAEKTILQNYYFTLTLT